MREIDDETALGEVYLASLLRAQLGLALRIIGLLAAGIGSLPLVFFVLPGLAGVGLLGLPLPWLLLGFLVYPAMIALGWHYVRRAERNERDFADLVSEVLSEGDR